MFLRLDHARIQAFFQACRNLFFCHAALRPTMDTQQT